MPLNSTRGAGSAKAFGFTAGAPAMIIASGGTETTSGNFKIHTFTGPGTFTVSSLAADPSFNVISRLIVGGGGGNYGGPGIGSGGGGAGGFIESKAPYDTYTASPLASSGGTPVSVTSFPISVGAGGGDASNGTPSSAFSVTSAGGGYGSTRGGGGGNGGSGGGSGDFGSPSGGAGNTPPVSPPQGNPGFAGSGGEAAGGGGGAAGGGPAGTPNAEPGFGIETGISGTSLTYSAGGDGEGPGDSNVSAPIRNAGGSGMGNGGTFPGSPTPNASARAGVVVIRYKYK